MSWETTRPGCQQLERSLRDFEEQSAAAVGLRLMLPQLRARPAAHCSVLVTLCSHAAGARHKSAHLKPAGAGPFASFSASAVSSTAIASSSEERQEESQQRLEAIGTILAAGFALPFTMVNLWSTLLAPAFGLLLNAIWPILTAVWGWLARCNCNKWRILKDWAEARLRKVGLRLRSFAEEKAIGMLMTKVLEVALKNLEGHLSPEQLDQLRQVLD